MINYELVKIAELFKFNITKNFVYGTINETLITLRFAPSGLSIDVNLFLFCDEEIEKIKKSIKNIIQQRHQINYDDQTKVFQINLLKKFRHNWEQYESVLSGIGLILNRPVQNSNSGIDFLSGKPFYILQIQKINSMQTSNSSTLCIRALRPLILGIFSSILISFVLQKVSFLNQFILSPLSLVLTLILVPYAFFKGLDVKESSFRRNLISLIFIILASFVASFYFGIFFSIPSEFQKTLDLIFHIFNQFSFFDIMKFLTPTVVLSGVMILGLVNKFSIIKVQIMNAQQAKNYLNITKQKGIILIGLILSSLLCLIALVRLNKPSTVVGEIPYLFYIIAFNYFAMSFILYKWIKNSLIRVNIKSPFENMLIALVFPIVIAMVSWHAINSFSAYLDTNKPILKIGIVSYFRDIEAISAICYKVIDIENKKILPFNLCESEDQFVKPGVEVSYYYQPGYFNNGIFTDRKILHSNTFEKLLEVNQNHLIQIRKSDFRYILSNDKTIDFSAYIKDWNSLCQTQDAVYCRFISYVLEDRNEISKAHKYLELGCSKKDYMSCYGLIFANVAGEITKKEHENQTLIACKKDDIAACLLYASVWQDNKNIDRRKELIRVLEKLCSEGDDFSCRRIPWENHRI